MSIIEAEVEKLVGIIDLRIFLRFVVFPLHCPCSPRPQRLWVDCCAGFAPRVPQLWPSPASPRTRCWREPSPAWPPRTAAPRSAGRRPQPRAMSSMKAKVGIFCLMMVSICVFCLIKVRFCFDNPQLKCFCFQADACSKYSSAIPLPFIELYCERVNNHVQNDLY